MDDASAAEPTAGRCHRDRGRGSAEQDQRDRSTVPVGVVADKVYEVTEISRADVQQTPRVGMHWKAEFINFITKWREDFVIVPNMERILS